MAIRPIPSPVTQPALFVSQQGNLYIQYPDRTVEWFGSRSSMWELSIYDSESQRLDEIGPVVFEFITYL